MATSLRIPDPLKLRAEAYAAKTGTSINTLACQGIALLLDKLDGNAAPQALSLAPESPPASSRQVVSPVDTHIAGTGRTLRQDGRPVPASPKDKHTVRSRKRKPKTRGKG